MKRWYRNEGMVMTILMNVVKRLILLIISSGASLFAGGVVVTPMIAWMNYLAEDGPIFPAPMVAFVVVAPIVFILFTMQGFLLIYEWIAKHRLGNSLLWIGAIGGLVAGLFPYSLAIAPFQAKLINPALLAFGGLGIFLGLIMFSCHWAANKLRTYLQRLSFAKQ